jgi:hypothetical protein
MAAVSCSNGTDPGSVSDLRIRAFKRGETKFTADTNRAVADRLVTLTLRCVPMVDGKGLVAISGGGHKDYPVIVESPVQDTLHGYDDSGKAVAEYSYLYVDFVANRPIERSWQVRFPVTPGSATFGISAVAILDSVYISEFNRWYDVHSDTARSHTPGGWGYNNTDKDDDLYLPTP